MSKIDQPQPTNTARVSGQYSPAWLWMALLLIGVGLITEQQVLFVVAACLLTVVPFAWVWKRLSLKRVEYRRSYGRKRAFPGETVAMETSITNRKLLPLTWLEATDEVPHALPLAVGELEATHNPKVGTIRNVLALRWYERYTRRYHMVCASRGVYRVGPARLRSGDLFTLFEEVSEVGAGDAVIVYPRIWPIEELDIPAKEPFGERQAHLRLLEDPIRSVGVRDYHPEDGMRRVHWKATAHSGRLQVRVFEPAATPTVVIILNVATFEHHWQGVLPERFENAVSVAGSIATWSVGQGYKTGLVANGCPTRSDQAIRVPSGRSPGQLAAILEALAAVTSFATSSLGAALRRESPRAPWGATFVVVTAVVTDDLRGSLLALRRAGRPIALVSLAEEDPGHVPGVVTYHLPPETPTLTAAADPAASSEAALDAAGLTRTSRRQPTRRTTLVPDRSRRPTRDEAASTA